MTRGLEASFEIMTQRIFLWKKWLKLFFERNLTQRIGPFLCLTQRIVFFLKTQRIEPFFLLDATNWTFCLFAAKNWAFFWKLLKELNLFCMTLRNELFQIWLTELNFFSNMTQRIYLKNIFLKDLNPFLFDSKNWPFSNMTQRIEPFFFEYDAKNWTLLLRIWRKELNPFFFEHDAKNCTLFLWIWAKNWAFFYIWLKELNLFFSEYDSKNWTIFLM